VVGLSELIKLAVFCDSLGIEVLDYCRAQNSGDLCCEMVGRHLGYWASIDSNTGYLSLAVENADYRDAPQEILRGIPPSDWKTLARTVSALEFAGVPSLARRPLEVVDRFGERWVSRPCSYSTQTCAEDPPSSGSQVVASSSGGERSF